jgi:hypothetical protein
MIFVNLFAIQGKDKHVLPRIPLTILGIEHKLEIAKVVPGQTNIQIRYVDFGTLASLPKTTNKKKP